MKETKIAKAINDYEALEENNMISGEVFEPIDYVHVGKLAMSKAKDQEELDGLQLAIAMIDYAFKSAYALGHMP